MIEIYRILIIEDDRTISSILEEHLNKWGYKVTAVQDFSDILPLFIECNPHLVIMDINLPYYDGFYWCAKIREISSVR
jgi:DNA-binding response OmpR family regulator